MRNYTNTGFLVPSDIVRLKDIFNENGFGLFIVGGAVRDFIMGDKPKDYDLCTNATPDQIKNMLKGSYRLDLVGEHFGVVIVYTPETPEGMEVATFREDISKGRNPEVKFGDVTIEQDVLRRDITINGLFFDLDKNEIIDLVGGISDLKNGVIRMIGDPMERIEEDPLRIFRVLRFATRYGFIIENGTREAILKYNDVSAVSMERIWDISNGEFFKSLKQAKIFQNFLDLVTSFGLWTQILPDIKVNTKLSSEKNDTLIMAQILSSNSIDVIANLKNISLPMSILNKIVFLKRMLDFSPENVTNLFKEKKRCKIEDSTILEWLLIWGVKDEMAFKFLKFKPSVDSQQVMNDFGLSPSKELGDKIKELETELFLTL